jgi:hypothetical protein
MIAVVSGSLLPAAHVHAESDHAVIVHRHLIDEVTPLHEPSINHEDHRSVQTLDVVFVVGQAHHVHGSIAINAFEPDAPRRVARGHVDALGDPVIHGPPGRSSSPRAPPA